MKKFLSLFFIFGIAGCAVPPFPSATYRDLSDTEKTALQKSLASNLGSTPAAQFRWAPVPPAPQKGAHTGYCAEIDARNPDGTRSGYRRFFALLIPNSNGELTSGVIQRIAANSSAGDPAASASVTASCRHWGYS